MADEPLPTEELDRLAWRREQAQEAGLTRIEARLFAESDADIGRLRELAEAGCPPDLIREIIL
jgi:hypothetical protein